MQYEPDCNGLVSGKGTSPYMLTWALCAAAADATALQEAGVPTMGEHMPEDTGLLVVTEEPAGRQQAATGGRAARLVPAGDRSTVEGSSMGESDTGSQVSEYPCMHRPSSWRIASTAR